METLSEKEEIIEKIKRLQQHYKINSRMYVIDYVTAYLQALQDVLDLIE